MHPLQHNIERPDYITLSGTKALAGMTVDSFNPAAATEQKNNPQTIEVNNLPGPGQVTVRWIAQGSSKYSITIDSRKVGTVEKSS